MIVLSPEHDCVPGLYDQLFDGPGPEKDDQEQFLKTNKNSVTVVTDDRWQQAQDWELEVWRNVQPASPVRSLLWAVIRRRPLDDDWNEWWRQQFDGYKCVPTALENVIEVGCGPYTNIRLIRPGRRIAHLYCSDPLARDYAGFKLGWLSHAYRNREILLDDHPAESLPFADNTPIPGKRAHTRVSAGHVVVQHLALIRPQRIGGLSAEESPQGDKVNTLSSAVVP